MPLKYDRSKSELTFSSGKKVYCFTDCLSLGSDDEYGRSVDIIYYGSDGGLETVANFEDTPDYCSEGALTPEECVEIADLMLERWQKFRAYFAAKTKE